MSSCDFKGAITPEKAIQLILLRFPLTRKKKKGAWKLFGTTARFD